MLLFLCCVYVCASFWVMLIDINIMSTFMD